MLLADADQGRDDLFGQIVHFLHAEEQPCYLAGGYVRDLLLSQPAKDVDVVVRTGAIPLARRLANATGGAFYALDEETDAARIVYPLAPAGYVVDIAAMRGPDLIADLKARDFTINAMAIDIRDAFRLDATIIDPCDGQRDLRDRTLRATSGQAFQRDAVRMLRALRFAVTLGYRIEPRTADWIERDAARIVDTSAERIRDELVPVVAGPGAAQSLRRMEQLGLLQHVLPEVAALRGSVQSEPHIHDVYEHTLAAVAEAERLGAWPHPQLGPDEQAYLESFAGSLGAHFNQVVGEHRLRSTWLKWAAILHDVAKPETSTLDEDGRIRAVGHPDLGAEMAGKVLRRLRFSAREVRLVRTVVAHHMRPGWLIKSGPVTGREVYRFFRDTGDAGIDVLMLALADQRATRGHTLQIDHWREYLELTQTMLEHFFRRPQEAVAPPTLITGRDVMSVLGIGPGPRVGDALEQVREAQAEGQVRTRQEALEYLRGR